MHRSVLHDALGVLRRVMRPEIVGERGFRLRKRAGILYRDLAYRSRMARLQLLPGPSLPAVENPALIVSVTSFPARIENAWITIETIFRQRLKPDRIVLVLSEEEFADRKLPERIERQRARGLEILWSPGNMRSFKKLLPVRERYPEAVIVVVDDDVLYEPWILPQLVAAHRRNPGAIIGHRGRVPRLEQGRLAPYATWPMANRETPHDRVLLTGAGGILFPPHVLPDAELLDYETARQLCPHADDVWFWAIALKAGVPRICLNDFGFISVRRQAGSPSLFARNRLPEGNDAQIDRTLRAFGIDPDQLPGIEAPARAK